MRYSSPNSFQNMLPQAGLIPSSILEGNLTPQLDEGRIIGIWTTRETARDGYNDIASR
jgi:hypothetical protein